MYQDPINPADLWEQKRAEGLSPEQATAFVQAQLAPQGAAPPSARTVPPAPGKRPAMQSAERAGATAAENFKRASAIEGAARALMQGASLGFSDEIFGAVRALGPETYREAVADERGILDQFRREHPAASTATELGGGLATGGVAGLARTGGRAASQAAARGLVRRGGQRALDGAAMGAVAGAGSAEGDLAERAEGAAMGGALGGVAGAVLPAIAERTVDGLRTVGNAALDAATGSTRRAAAAADEAVLQALADDGVPLTNLRRTGEIAAGREARGQGKPTILADLGGESVADLAPARGGKGVARAMEQRGAGRLGRVQEDLRRGLGGNGRTADELAEELTQRREANARPLYEEAYARGKVEVPELAEALENVPAFRAAYERGRRIAAAEGIPLPPLFEAGKGAAGQLVDLPDVRGVDYMQRGLRDLIGSRTRAGKLGKTEARALQQRLNNVLARVDEAVPEFAAARQQYGQDSRAIQALELGRGLLKENAAQVARKIGPMNDAEREAFRVGALDALRGVADRVSDGADVVRKLWGSEEKRALLRAAFPDAKTFADFRRSVLSELRMSATEKRLARGGQGAAAATRPGNGLAGAAARAALNAGGLPGFGTELLRYARQRIAAGDTEDLTEELAKRLQVRPGTEEYRALMAKLAYLQGRWSRRADRGRVGASAAGAAAGLATN